MIFDATRISMLSLPPMGKPMSVSKPAPVEQLLEGALSGVRRGADLGTIGSFSRRVDLPGPRAANPGNPASVLNMLVHIHGF